MNRRKATERPSNRLLTLSGICLVLAIMAAAVWFSNRPGVRPPPSAPGYYSGPMKSKGGDPTVYGTDDGQRVAPPPGAQTAPAKADGPGKNSEGGT